MTAPSSTSPLTRDPLPGYTPAIWRGMTGVGAGVRRPVFGIALMTFEGSVHQFALSDLDLWRMVEQIVGTLPGERARQLRAQFQHSTEGGEIAGAGLMPLGQVGGLP